MVDVVVCIREIATFIIIVRNFTDNIPKTLDKTSSGVYILSRDFCDGNICLEPTCFTLKAITYKEGPSFTTSGVLVRGGDR